MLLCRSGSPSFVASDLWIEGFPLRRSTARLRRPLDLGVASASIGEFKRMNVFGRRKLVIFAGLMLAFLFSRSVQAAREEFSGSIRDMMTPEEFKAAGLNKLSPEELQKLDAWLQGYRQATEKKATARAERSKLDMLVSRVDGTFNGLTGKTVIRLEDGTVWKQANADDRFRPRVTDHPAAVVIHGIFGYKMRIEGTGEFYVDPVRNP